MVHIVLGVVSVVLMSGLALGLLLLSGDGRAPARGTGVEVRRETVALAVALGSFVALAAIIASGNPDFSLEAAPAMHAVMVIATFVGTAWWFAEWLSGRRSGRGSPGWRIWPPSRPASRKAPRAGSRGRANTARFNDAKRRVDLYRRQLTIRHLLFTGVVLGVVGGLLTVMPVANRGSDCGSVLMYLQGNRVRAFCVDVLITRAWMALPAIALGIVVVAGALLFRPQNTQSNSGYRHRS